MNTPQVRLLRTPSIVALAAAMLLSQAAPAFATDETVSGNLTVTNDTTVGGDIHANNFIFANLISFDGTYSLNNAIEYGGDGYYLSVETQWELALIGSPIGLYSDTLVLGTNRTAQIGIEYPGDPGYDSSIVLIPAGIGIVDLRGPVLAESTLELSHLLGGGSAPTIAAGTGAGTSPTIAVSGSDAMFTITVTTGASPSANATVATVTFANAYDSGSHVHAVFSPNNAASAGVGTSTYQNTSTTTFVLKGTLAASTQYSWDVFTGGTN